LLPAEVKLYVGEQVSLHTTIVKIHTRTLLILGATVFALIVVLAVVAQFFILSSSTQIEMQESAADVALVSGEIQSAIETLGGSLRAWAVSDATCRFVQDADPEYIRLFLDPPSFHERLRIDGVLIYNATGSLVYSGGFADRDAGMGAGGVVPELAAYLETHRDVLVRPAPSGLKRKQGFILLPHGPVIVAMHTILPASGDALPGRGTFVVVRSFDAREIAALQATVHMPVRISGLNDPAVPGSTVAAELAGPLAPASVSRILNPSTMIGSALVKDIGGQPVLLLEVQTPRHMNTQATASILFILVAFLVIGIIYAIVTWLLLHRYIITHLTGLDSSVKEIADKRDLSRRIPVSGDDEIASLKASLNRMLGELEEKEQDLSQAHRKANLYLDICLDVLTYEILNAAIAQRVYAELLLESEGEDKKKYVSAIVDIINRSREVIKNIEVISAIYKNPPLRVPTDLGAVLHRVAGDYPDVAIRCEDCGVTVLADGSLGIVFDNLIRNSVKYGGSGVQVTISARGAGEGMIEISVADTGKGIPDQMKTMIFDRFTKGSENRGRYGLGLQIVKMLVEAYGGRVWADDRVAGHPGEGAAIRFTLCTA